MIYKYLTKTRLEMKIANNIIIRIFLFLTILFLQEPIFAQGSDNNAFVFNGIDS